MLELFGILFLVWIGWIFISGYLKANSVIRSQEYGKEAKFIATNELHVPEWFYTETVVNHIDEVKKIALLLQKTSGYHKNFSWPRLMAWAVFVIYTLDEEDTYGIGSRLGTIHRQLTKKLGINLARDMVVNNTGFLYNKDRVMVVKWLKKRRD